MQEMSTFLLAIPLFILGVYFFIKSKSSWFGNLFFGISFIFIIFLFLSYLIVNYFTGEGINDAVIYHLKYGLAGSGFGEYKFIIISGIILTFLGILALVFIFYFSNKKERRFSYSLISFLLIVLSVVSNPSSFEWYAIFKSEFLADAIPAAGAQLEPHINIVLTSSTVEIVPADPFSFDALYHVSSLVSVADTHPNLVFLYLEGLEQTYSLGSAFPGLTPELDKLSKEGIFFSNYDQFSNTGFTMGGMVASQCGIPLITPSGGNSMSGMDKYLAGARCLGDLLHEQNYYLSYIGGARSEFAGKDLLYNTHGFDEFYGYDDLLPRLADKSRTSGWGINDDITLDILYNRFEELSSIGQNFGLFSITLDTHPPRGHHNVSCSNIVYGNGKNIMLNSVACADYLVGQFVNKIRTSPYAGNTVIVLASDHLGLENDATKLLNREKRLNRVIILAPNRTSREISKHGSTIDTASIVLPLLGFSGEVGLGRNLLVDDSEIDEESKYIRENVVNWKQQIISLWKFPKIEQFALSNVSNGTVNIDSRVFKMPVLVEVSNDMETKLRFKFDSAFNALISYVNSASTTSNFLLFDTCKEVKKIYNNVADKDNCLLFGRANDWRATVLRGDNYFSTDDIKRILQI